MTQSFESFYIIRNHINMLHINSNYCTNSIIVYGFSLHDLKVNGFHYIGTYSNDDIAASMAMSFCTTTSRIVTLYARQHNAKSVVFAGGFLCQPAMRECLEECFTAESLILPFTGVCITVQ